MKLGKTARRMFAEPEVDPRSPFEIMQDVARETLAAREADRDADRQAQLARLGFSDRAGQPGVTVSDVQAMLMDDPNFVRDMQAHIGATVNTDILDSARQTIDRYLAALGQMGRLPVGVQLRSRITSSRVELDAGHLRFDLVHEEPIDWSTIVGDSS